MGLNLVAIPVARVGIPYNNKKEKGVHPGAEAGRIDTLDQDVHGARPQNACFGDGAAGARHGLKRLRERVLQGVVIARDEGKHRGHDQGPLADPPARRKAQSTIARAREPITG